MAGVSTQHSSSKSSELAPKARNRTRGSGSVATLIGATIGAASSAGHVDYLNGALIFGSGTGAGTVVENTGLEVLSGAYGGGTVTNDYSIYVYQPYATGPIGSCAPEKRGVAGGEPVRLRAGVEGASRSRVDVDGRSLRPA